MIILILWYLIGLGTILYIVLQDDDLQLKYVWLVLLASLLGPIIVVLAFKEKVFKLPKIFDGENVVIKKFKKK